MVVRPAANTRGRWLLSAAAATGIVHAGFSLYWAVGGHWLLPTVGQWAVDLGAEEPRTAELVLAMVAAIKTTGAIAPLYLATAAPSGFVRVGRALCWGGAGVLLVYGAVNTVVAHLVLTGVIHPDGGHDELAMIGHGFLWDPLFLAWGILLAAGLYAVRRQRRTQPVDTHRGA